MPDDAFADLWVPLRGTIVHLEPLAPEHEEGLWDAARLSDWTWMPFDAGASHDAFRRWFAHMQRGAAAESIAPFTTRLADGRIVGGTTYHDIRPEHGRFEIGGTWLARDMAHRRQYRGEAAPARARLRARLPAHRVQDAS